MKVMMLSIRYPAKPLHFSAQYLHAGCTGADTVMRCQSPCRLDDCTRTPPCLPAHGVSSCIMVHIPSVHVHVSPCLGLLSGIQGPSSLPRLQQAAPPSRIHLLRSLLSLQFQRRLRHLHLLEGPCCCSPVCHISPAQSEGCAGRPLIHCPLTGRPDAPAGRQHTCRRDATASHHALAADPLQRRKLTGLQASAAFHMAYELSKQSYARQAECKAGRKLAYTSGDGPADLPIIGNCHVLGNGAGGQSHLMLDVHRQCRGKAHQLGTDALRGGGCCLRLT